MQTINALLQTPQPNFFSLVRHPNQTSFDFQRTDAPVAPFDSGFAGYTSIQIRDYLVGCDRQPIFGSELPPPRYALLDELSIASETVVLGHGYSTLGMRDPEFMTDDDYLAWEQEIEEHGEANDAWREWRVRFGDANFMAALLEGDVDLSPKLYNDTFVAQFTDADGIFDFDTARKTYENAPHDEL